MLKTRIKALLIAFVMLLGVVSSGLFKVDITSNAAFDSSNLSYLENTSNENASLILGSSILGTYISYIDGLAEGVTSVTDPLYSEKITIDTLTGRGLNRYGSIYFKVDSNFYDANDTEFLISVVYYDFNDDSSDLKLEYYKKDGSRGEAILKKENRTQGWNVATVGVNDIDFSRLYASGPGKNRACARVISGSDNVFRKIEVANVSNLRRENIASDMTALGSRDSEILLKFGIIEENDPIFFSENLWKQCSRYDLIKLFNILVGKREEAISESYKGLLISQGEMLQRFLKIAGFNASGDYVTYAYSTGLIDAEDFFISNSSNATYYNLLKLICSCLYYDPNPSDGIPEMPAFKKMLESGAFNGTGLETLRKIGNEDMVKIYLYDEKKLPSITQEGIDGVQYNFVNYYGDMLYRPYVSQNSWTKNGEVLLGSTYDKEGGKNPYHIYAYNIKTETVRYIGDTNGYLNGIMGDDDYVYYLNIDESTSRVGIWKKHAVNEGAAELIYMLPEGFPSGMTHITNDSRYLSMEVGKREFFGIPENTTPIVRIDLKEKTYKWVYYAYNYSNMVNHIQVNPVYPELMFFAHETDITQFHYRNSLDRSRIINIDTGEVTPLEAGCDESTDFNMLFFSHERWSYNGKYLYI